MICLSIKYTCSQAKDKPRSINVNAQKAPHTSKEMVTKGNELENKFHGMYPGLASPSSRISDSLGEGIVLIEQSMRVVLFLECL